MKKLGVEKAMSKVEVSRQVKKLGIDSIARLVGILFFWFLFVIFLQIGQYYAGLETLTEILTTIVLYIPRVIVAVIDIGLVVTNYMVGFAVNMLKEFEVEKLIEPVESIVEREGFTLKVISYVLKMFVMLIFVQIAVGILNSEGLFNQLAEFVNTVILWIPNLIVGLFIGLIGF